jgi:endonuclease-3
MTDWRTIMEALESWRETLPPPGDEDGAARRGGGKDDPDSGAADPSVTTIAERYRQDPWAVLVSTILSLRTKDEVTLVSSGRLLKRSPTPESFLALPEGEAERLIYPAGFYRTKAANLRRIAAILLEKYGGRVPADMDTLLALPGVGRKTANLVLIEAFDMDGICVDTHVHRISNRQGWLGEGGSKSPGETEAILRRVLPRKYWKGINSLLVLYGQRICRPISPYCSRCVISRGCARRGVERSR